MGIITDKNAKLLEESDVYPGSDLEGMLDDQFPMILDNLIRKKKKSIKYIIEHCNISKSYLNELRNPSTGKTGKNPSRVKLLDICMEIGATVEETNLLLKSAGHKELYSRKTFDSLIMWGMRKGMSGSQIKEKLIAEGFNIFGE